MMIDRPLRGSASTSVLHSPNILWQQKVDVCVTYSFFKVFWGLEYFSAALTACFEKWLLLCLRTMWPNPIPISLKHCQEVSGVIDSANRSSTKLFSLLRLSVWLHIANGVNDSSARVLWKTCSESIYLSNTLILLSPFLPLLGSFGAISLALAKRTVFVNWTSIIIPQNILPVFPLVWNSIVLMRHLACCCLEQWETWLIRSIHKIYKSLSFLGTCMLRQILLIYHVTRL